MCVLCSTCTPGNFQFFDLKYILILVTCTWYFACISELGSALVPSVLEQQASGPCDMTVSFSCVLNKIKL